MSRFADFYLKEPLYEREQYVACCHMIREIRIVKGCLKKVGQGSVVPWPQVSTFRLSFSCSSSLPYFVPTSPEICSDVTYYISGRRSVDTHPTRNPNCPTIRSPIPRFLRRVFLLTTNSVSKRDRRRVLQGVLEFHHLRKCLAQRGGSG